MSVQAMHNTLIKNALIVTADGSHHGWLLTRGAFIAAVGAGTDIPGGLTADIVIDANGAMLMPGAIDTHVHFREPGLTEKGTIASESAAAVAGGVTSYLEMPNTVPNAVTPEAITHKQSLAEQSSLANHAFFIGATNDNIDRLLTADYTRIPGVKLFMGSSTGNMLVDNDEAISALFSRFKGVIAVHAEDEATISAARDEIMAEYGDDAPVNLHHRLRSAEACYRASRRAVELARITRARLHLLHISTEAELSLLDNAPLAYKNITAETCPHYLLWHHDMLCDGADGALKKCNPSIKSTADRAALRQAVIDGKIDTIATDHAPHLRRQKCGSLFQAASGMPGIKFMLTSLLDLAADSQTGFTPSLIVKKCCENPAIIYGIEGRGRLIPGYYADLTLIERTNPHTITHADAVTRDKSGEPIMSGTDWTPHAGMTTRHRVVMTMVNGKTVYNDGRLTGARPAMPLKFKS